MTDTAADEYQTWVANGRPRRPDITVTLFNGIPEGIHCHNCDQSVEPPFGNTSAKSGIRYCSKFGRHTFVEGDGSYVKRPECKGGIDE